MELREAPSGAFKYSIRKATFGDQRLRSQLANQDKWSYAVGGVATREPGYTPDDMIVVEIWAVTTEVQVAHYDKEGNVTYKALDIERGENGRYMRAAFEAWLNQQDIEDVLAMHAAVTEVNPKWN